MAFTPTSIPYPGCKPSASDWNTNVKAFFDSLASKYGKADLSGNGIPYGAATGMATLRTDRLTGIPTYRNNIWQVIP